MKDLNKLLSGIADNTFKEMITRVKPYLGSNLFESLNSELKLRDNKHDNTKKWRTLETGIERIIFSYDAFRIGALNRGDRNTSIEM